MILVPLPSCLPFPANSNSNRFLLPRRLCRSPSSGASRHLRVRPPSASGDRDVDDFTKYSGYLFDLSISETNSLFDYDISKIAAIYRKRPLVVLRRVVQVGTTLGKWFGLRYLDSVNERSEELFKVRASQLRKILVQLGPAYIKIAQAISSRADLIPPSYLDELSLLQDRIAPFSSELAFNTIEQELGSPIDVLFSEVSPEPVAAASLGQVYQARLRPSGQVVAVKVQRPGVQAAISLDILILRFLAGLVRRAGKFNTDLPAVVDEWASSLFREMDYKREAKNGLKFRQLYGGLQDVVVPEMYMEQTTSRVLVMEWVEGTKLSEVKDLYLIEVGVYCSFNQLLEYGFYHADPHPGNLLRTYDGKLAYLDFGMMGEFKEELRDGFIEACLHLVNRDFDALAEDFVTLGLLPPTSDKVAVTKALTGIFQSAVDKGVQNISFGDLLGDLGTTMYKFKFQIPSYFSLVIRSLAVLEGIAINFDSSYKVLGSTYPWIAKKVLSDSSPKLQSSLRGLLYEDGVFRIDRLESLISESLRAKTDKSLGKKPKEEKDSMLMVKQILSFTLNDKGAFVREILLEELAKLNEIWIFFYIENMLCIFPVQKGLDALGVATVDSITSALPFSALWSFSSMADEDVINLRTLRRLLLLLSGPGENESPIMGIEAASPYAIQKPISREVSIASFNFASVQDILPIFSALSPEMQQEVFRLPASVGEKLISRMVARTLRRFFL